MSLAAGQALSFYEVIGPLGAGGMGEVYRARDTKLDREVAGQSRLLLVGPGDTDERPFLDPDYDEELECFSPEGDWMLYLSDRTGEEQAYLAPFPPGDADRSWPVSADGADAAWFSDELDEIVFRDDDEVLRVSLQLDEQVELGRPEPLFTLPDDITLEDYDGAGRFLAVRKTEAGPVKLYVDTEWARDL